jgi:hypothetical protein
MPYSNQFPARRRNPSKVGRLIYYPYEGHPGQVLLSGEPWWKLEQERKQLVCRGYKKENFIKTY